MILPSKHISQKKALLTIGAVLLNNLNHPKTVSALWEDVRYFEKISFDWFILTLDLLYAINIIEFHDGLLIKKGVK